MDTTTIRIDVATHRELKRLAAENRATVCDTVALAVRRLRQEQMGLQLKEPLRQDETKWLDAELG